MGTDGHPAGAEPAVQTARGGDQGRTPPHRQQQIDATCAARRAAGHRCWGQRRPIQALMRRHARRFGGGCALNSAGAGKSERQSFFMPACLWKQHAALTSLVTKCGRTMVNSNFIIGVAVMINGIACLWAVADCLW